MTGIIRIDRVAITADVLMTTYAFYDELFGAEVGSPNTWCTENCWCGRSHWAARC
jgi:hypothetical protein